VVYTDGKMDPPPASGRMHNQPILTLAQGPPALGRSCIRKQAR